MSQAAPPDQVKLALERTFLAHERTLMAWIRTSSSLITFGFALYKFFYFTHQNRPATEVEQILGARVYGMCMMGLGALAIVIATWQYRQRMQAFRGMWPEMPQPLSLLVAAPVAFLGFIGFVAALFRL